ncbi:MAG: class B sortase [Lachnospiraceae bacterium]|nr:class B sortase [Lachnospiraceae bacterium]
MNKQGWNVEGRQFRTKSDYDAACRDKQKIDQLKSLYQIKDSDEIQKILNRIHTNQLRFETMVGTDFKEDLEERLRVLSKNAGKSATDKAGKLAGKKENGKTGNEKKRTRKTRQQAVAELEQYDEAMKKVVLAELKKQERRRRLLVILCSLVAVGCFGYFSVYYYFAERTGSAYEQMAELKGSDLLTGVGGVRVHKTGEDGKTPEILDEYKTLYNTNKRLIGWLKIDDTNIDYPVMQTENNEYYLTHNSTQEYDKNGSIFLDTNCDVIKPSTNLIVYGHHMSSGKMFGQLDKYSTKEYYDEHPVIQFDSIYEKGTYQIMYVFRSRVYTTDEITFKYYQFIDAASEEAFDSAMNEMSEMSLYDTGITASYGDELLTLSTCDHYEQYGRFVVVAKRID